MPASCGLIRPSGVTAVASLITRPAPPWAKAPRWTRCQSLGRPSWEEYWHMGETHTRLRNVVPRRVRGSKRLLTSAATRAAGDLFLASAQVEHDAAVPGCPWKRLWHTAFHIRCQGRVGT